MIVYRFIKYLIINIKYTRLLRKIYRDEMMLEKLSQLFNTKFKIDWIGRIYAVINPNLIDGNYDINTMIFEYDENGLNNNEFVVRNIMLKLNLVKNFIQANNLFDLLTYEIKKIDEYGNYLFIISPISLPDCLKYTKFFTILLSVLIIALITILIIL